MGEPGGAASAELGLSTEVWGEHWHGERAGTPKASEGIFRRAHTGRRKIRTAQTVRFPIPLVSSAYLSKVTLTWFSLPPAHLFMPGPGPAKVAPATF